MNHKSKVKIARKLLTHKEKQVVSVRTGKRIGTPIFQSEAWMKRKEARRLRVAKKQGAAHARALKRKGM